MSNLLTFKECMAYLRVGERTLYRYVKEGKVPYKRLGREYRFRKEELDEYLEGKNK